MGTQDENNLPPPTIYLPSRLVKLAGHDEDNKDLLLTGIYCPHFTAVCVYAKFTPQSEGVKRSHDKRQDGLPGHPC